ncbi:MAG: outer membrane protein assembly factor BamB family protein [Deltaproteobacteria bacterium]
MPNERWHARSVALLLLFGSCCAATGAAGGRGTSSTGGGGSSTGGSGSSSGGTAGGMTCHGSYGTVSCPPGFFCNTEEPTCYCNKNNSNCVPPSGGTSTGGATGGTTSGGTTGAPGQPAADEALGWTRWHHDALCSGRTSADTSKLHGTVAWKLPVGAPSQGSTYENSPVVAKDGTVYAVAVGGMLHAVSPAGSQLWSIQVGDPAADPHTATPALLADGSLYVISGNDQSTSGPVFWHVSSKGALLSSATSGEPDDFDGTPLVGPDGTLYEAIDSDSPGLGNAFLVADGPSPLSPMASAAVTLLCGAERVGVALLDDGRSFWCTCTGCYGVTSLDAGFTQLPSWPSGGVALATPSALVENTPDSDLAVDVDAGLVFGYVAWVDDLPDGGYAFEGNLSGIELEDGGVRWSLPLPPVTLSQGEVAFTIASGSNVDYAKAAPAIGASGTVYVGAGDGLRSVDEATGQQRWLFASPEVTAAPAIGGDGKIFFGCVDGTFYALKPDGTLRFKLSTGGTISSSPAIAQDGSVYFLSDDGNLYAIH